MERVEGRDLGGVTGDKGEKKKEWKGERGRATGKTGGKRAPCKKLK